MKYNKNELTKKELEARARFEKDYATKLDIDIVLWSEDRYFFIDACVVSGNTNCYLELKERYCNLDTYKTAMIEKKKVIKMLERTKDKDVIPLLICMYTNNRCIAFNLKTILPIEETIINMQSNNYNDENEDKEVYMYSISDAIIIN